MKDVKARLVTCFRAVFQGLAEGAIRTATVESVEQWNSVAMATLTSVVEEEFSVTVSPEDMEEFDSFSRIAAYLERRLA